MLDRIKRPLARLGANFIDGIWRLGVIARFFAMVLASSGTSFSRFRLVMREVYFTGVLSLVIIIVSGLFGIWVYARPPTAMSANRFDAEGAITEKQMIEGLKQLDRQIHDAAQPLDPEAAAVVDKSLEENVFAGSAYARVMNRYPKCQTRAAIADVRKLRNFRPRLEDDPFEKVDTLLSRKEALLAKLRRHLQLKSWLQSWLFIHVPATFALIAALSAHVISVFFYW